MEQRGSRNHIGSPHGQWLHDPEKCNYGEITNHMDVVVETTQRFAHTLRYLRVKSGDLTNTPAC